MKAKWVHEIEGLVRSPEFGEWYQEFIELTNGFKKVKLAREDLLAQASMMHARADFGQQCADEKLFAAGECEDSGAAAHAEFAEIENNSFEALSAYEVQRQKASDTWMELDRHDASIEDMRQEASELIAGIEAGKKQGDGDSGSAALGDRLERIEAAIEARSQDVEEVRTRYDRDTQRKLDLWDEVEASWSRAFQANLGRSEYAYQSRRLRGEAEAQFVRAAQERKRVDELEVEAHQLDGKLVEYKDEIGMHIKEGRSRFECTIVEEFLYWPKQSEVRMVLCVPLVDDRDYLNIQVQALSIYQLDRAKGLDFIEPVAESTETAGEDPRLTAFFARAHGS
jgi:hypothetical protein